MQKYTELKDQGNTLFKEKKFTQAIRCFQSTIDLVSQQQSLQNINNESDIGKLFVILNINAAFAGLSLKTKESYRQAENFCNVALNIDPKNQKGLYRRALANKELAELIEIQSKGTSEELLQLYNKAKRDLEEVMVVDKTNDIAKQKLSEVVKNIYRVTVTQGKQVNLSSKGKVEEVKGGEKKVEVKVEAPKPKKTGDMNKILKEYKVEEVTLIARNKIQQQCLNQELPKNRAELEKAIRQIEKSKEVFVKFIYRLSQEYLRKIQPTFDMLFKLIQTILESGEGDEARQALEILKGQKAFDLLWKGYTGGEKGAFRKKCEQLGVDMLGLK